MTYTSTEERMRAAGGTRESYRPNGADDPGTASSAAATEPIWIDDDEWIEADLPLRPWIVPGYLLRGAVTLVCGPPSAMKSSLMLGWASAMALHRDHGDFRHAGPPPPSSITSRTIALSNASGSLPCCANSALAHQTSAAR